MNPTERLVAEMRSAAHRDIDAIFDAWPSIHENRRSRSSAFVREGPGRMSSGSHSDPTGEAASTTTPFAIWLRNVEKALRGLNTLVAQTEPLIGKPACMGCGEDIGVRPSRRLRGLVYHDDGCLKRVWRSTRSGQTSRAA